MEFKNTRIAFLGGDLRLIHASRAFEAEGAKCVFWGTDGCSGSQSPLSDPAEALRSADLAILGIPVSRDSNTLNAPFAHQKLRLSELVELASIGQKFAMGMAPVRFREALEAKGCICYDYYQDERFSIANALATAEGAIAIAIGEHPDTLFGASTAILGFGRIAKQLALRLKALGAHVTVFARRESDLIYATTLGCEAEPITRLGECADRFDLFFNTIPMRLVGFPSPDLKGIIIDLAPIYPESDTPKLLRAPSLPFKYSPRSSGKLIHDCIAKHFSAESEGNL